MISDTLLFIQVFEPLLHDFNEDFDTSSNVLLRGWSMDTRIRHGNWTIIGQHPIRSDVDFPNYKVKSGDKVWLTDVRKKKLRVISDDEAQKFSNYISSSPMIFEKAFWAHHGRGQWMPYFYTLLI